MAKPTTKLRITTGSDTFLDNVDGRSRVARRYRDILDELVADQGGDVSAAKGIIAKPAATISVWCEMREAELAAGKAIDIAAFTTATNALRRLLCDIGIEKKLRDITPSLAEYVDARRVA